MSEVGVATLTEFLLARIIEDEGFAPKYHESMCEWMMRGDRGATESHCDCGLAARRRFHLAECEAKRQVVVNMGPGPSGQWPTNGGWVLRTLALPYAEHPDYRGEWKP